RARSDDRDGHPRSGGRGVCRPCGVPGRRSHRRRAQRPDRGRRVRPHAHPGSVIMMFSLTIKSILANKARFLLTSIAVLLGVAFMAGTFVLTDTIKKSYDDIASNVYRSTDAVVRSARETKSTNQGGADTRGTISASMLEAVRAVPGVQAAEAQQLGIAVIVGH